jgi:hypothetical protein
MAQLSRPYQIALLALGLFAAVWFVALRGHSTNTNGSGSPAAASAPAAAASVNKTPSSTAAAEAKAAAAPTPIYHGAAPGVEGLTRAINKAHGAVATSQQNAKQLEEKSAQASDSTSTGTSAGASTAGSQPTSASASVTPSTSSTSTSLHKPAVTHKGATAPSAKSVSAAPSRQTRVERELKQGNVVAILFWNPKASVDIAVQHELQLLLAVHRRIQPFAKNQTVQRLLKAFGLELEKKVAVQEAHAGQVASFGSFTRTVQVYQTPTILIVNKRGQTTTLTGLTDAYSIEQAIDEARHA